MSNFDPYEICPLATCVSDDFSDFAVIAFDLESKESFLAETFKFLEEAQKYVADKRRFKMSYDFIIGDYTYRKGGKDHAKTENPKTSK